MTQKQLPAVKVALISLAGTSIEWYDFFLYGTAAALVFPVVFFPAELPPLVALIAAFTTFSVGFIARPVGGVLFGHFGDRLGRKRALVVALLMMGGATALIGCLPSYAVAGPLAPLLLVVLRFVQGLAIGGQWGGAVLLAAESAPKHRRGLYGSFAQAGAPVGVILANLAFLLVSANVSQEAFMSWGWRVPFLASVLLIVLALYAQLRLEDTPAFRELQTKAATQPKQRSPVIEAIRAYPRQILLAAGAVMAIQVTFYILVTFVVAYATSATGLKVSREVMLTAVLIGAVVMVPAVFISADVSDRRGRRGVFMLGALILGLWSFVMFPLIETGSFLWITVAVSVGQLCVGIMYGPQAAFFAEMFRTQVRYSGASLGYQLGAILGGALAPVIATALLAKFGGSFAISAYISAACLVTIASVYALKETYQSDIDAVEPPSRDAVTNLVHHRTAG